MAAPATVYLSRLGTGDLWPVEPFCQVESARQTAPGFGSGFQHTSRI